MKLDFRQAIYNEDLISKEVFVIDFYFWFYAILVFVIFPFHFYPMKSSKARSEIGIL